ncbi:MAG TPA: MerR family transcriptional regulator [Kofleriaceae bacterium]|nr:MerR family transcriptional regulator [Kofleriaceae bacterium]
MKTAELAMAAGIAPSAVRYYERRGLLSDPGRTPAGYRDYPPDTVESLLFIQRAQELGFTLREIKKLLELRGQPRACIEMCNLAEQKVGELEEEIRRAQRAKRLLTSLISGRRPRARTTNICPIGSYLEKGHGQGRRHRRP